ncbi:MAG: cysteine-rich CWC family protein [Halioglobus sp.]
MKIEQPPQQSICPLCGEGNLCAVSRGGDIEQCWCWNAGISGQALEKVPPQLVGKVCICANCAKNKGEKSLE